MKRIIAFVVVVAVGVTWFVTRASGATAAYRTAVATTHSVTHTIDEVGVVEPVSAASVAFPLAGTVATVPVAVGAAVTRGQTLATLDTSALQDAVQAAQAQLDQARLALANALAANAQAAANSASSSQQTDQLDQARQAVLADQKDVDAKIGAAQAALENANQVCANVSQDNVSDCQAALNEVMAAQADVQAAETALSDASNALEALRNQAQSSRSPQGGGTASAADLVRFQKDIDAAAAGVAVAQQNVAAATIVSPLDGTVEAIGFQPGDHVTAASTTAVVRVVGPSGFEVTAIVPVDDLKDVKLGQAATVTPDGTHRSLSGQVVSIGAPRTSNSTTTYPVAIGVNDDAALRNGTVAGVAITTSEVTSGVAVPTSAVQLVGRRKTVTVLNGNTPKVVDVAVGVVGREWTQITSGLRAGQRVVLADLNQPLPSAVTSSTNGTNNTRGPVVGLFPGGGGGNGPALFRGGG